MVVSHQRLQDLLEREEEVVAVMPENIIAPLRVPIPTQSEEVEMGGLQVLIMDLMGLQQLLILLLEIQELVVERRLSKLLQP